MRSKVQESNKVLSVAPASLCSLGFEPGPGSSLRDSSAAIVGANPGQPHLPGQHQPHPVPLQDFAAKSLLRRSVGKRVLLSMLRGLGRMCGTCCLDLIQRCIVPYLKP